MNIELRFKTLWDIQPILQELCSQRYMYKGELLDHSNETIEEGMLVLNFQCNKLIENYSISKTREEWKEYYEELTGIFLGEA